MPKTKFINGDRVVGNDKKAPFRGRTGIITGRAHAGEYWVEFDDGETECVRTNWLDLDQSTKQFDRSELVVEISGMPMGHHSKVDNDIRGWSHLVGELAKKLYGLPFHLRRVIVTPQFDLIVNQLLEIEPGEFTYIAERNEIIAVGKILPIFEHGELGFTLVIDSRVAVWDQPQENPYLFEIIIHELSHVVFEEQHVKRLGIPLYQSAEWSREWLLNVWAQSLIDEFKVDRLVDAVMMAAAKDDAGEPVSLRRVREAQGGDWPQHLLVLADQLVTVVDREITAFIVRQRLIGDLFPAIPKRIKDFLVFTVHTYAVYGNSEQWIGIWTQLKETECYKRFLASDLDEILSALGEPGILVSDAGIAELIGLTANRLERIIQKAGLRLETVADGDIYVHVDYPSGERE